VTGHRRLVSVALDFLSFFLLFHCGTLAARQRIATQAASPGVSEASRLIVHVRDESGAAFSELAMVNLQSVSSSNVVSAPTDGGQTIFDGLGLGAYTVVVTAPGYVTVSERVEISISSQQEQIFVTLKLETDSRIVSAPVGPPMVSPKLQKELSKAVEALHLNKLDAAQKHLDAASRLAPSNPEVSYLRGLLADRQGDVAAAKSSWQKTLSLDPKHTLALLALGTILARTGDFAGAKVYLERSLETDPDSWHAHELLSIVCFRQGAYQEAVTHAERSLELGKSLANGARLPLAEALMAQNEPDRAANTLNVFLQGDPPQAQAAVARRLLKKLKDGEAPAQPASAGDPPLPTQVSIAPEESLLKLDLPKWLPSNVDDSVPAVEPGVACPLQKVLDGAAERVLEFTKTVDRFTATESLDHQVVDEWGLPTREEKRSFNYVVSIVEVSPGYLNVEEYRNGTQDLSVFPDAIATRGLPAVVLLFHPYYRGDFDLSCEGLGRWKGGLAWQVHFSPKPGKRSRLRGYRASVNGPSVPIPLKGRAWIEKSSLQVVRVETDLEAPMPEIKLLAEHQDIEFGPVRFRNQRAELWLPMTADIYFDLHGHRIRRKTTFQNYLLFSVDEKQSISAPKEAKTP
jgi:Tfp pilus assembly protein PilF